MAANLASSSSNYSPATMSNRNCDKVNANFVSVKMPEAGTTIYTSTSIYMTEIKEVVLVNSFTDRENTRLWTKDSVKDIDIMTMHEEDQEEKSAACMSVVLLWKRDKFWNGACRAKMRMSPAVIQDESIFFVIHEIFQGLNEEVVKSSIQSQLVKEWIYLSNMALMRVKENNMRKMFYCFSQIIDEVAFTSFGQPTVLAQNQSITDRGQVTKLLTTTLPILTKETLVKLVSVYMPHTINKTVSC